MHILVFDLGLYHTQKQELELMSGVEITSLPWDELPRHLREAGLYAWKPTAMFEALKRHEKIIYLDSAVEVRQPLDSVKQLINDIGYFFVVQVTHAVCFNALVSLPQPWPVQTLILSRFGHMAASIGCL